LLAPLALEAAMPFITNLWFDTEAEEAAAFYTSVFPHSSIDQIAYYGPENSDRNGQVMVVYWTANGQQFAGINGGPQFSFDEAVSFEIRCADQAEVDHWWTTLSEGGSEGPCGWLKDKFGVSWQVVPEQMEALMLDPDRERANRAVGAMLTMGKLDIAALQRAADGVEV